MRRPLRLQILVPLVGLVLVALAAVSGINAYLSVRDAKRKIQDQLERVADTLANSNFPLTDAVLRQAGGLSGAEFVAAGETGEIVSASRPDLTLPEAKPPIARGGAIDLERQVSTAGGSYFHAVTRLPRRSASGGALVLHIFYPVETYRAAWRRAVVPPLAVGGLAILAAVPLGIAIAGHVSHPIARLRTQVNQIAGGDFQSMALPRRDDEILDLCRSVNRMAEMLARYEEEVRQSERLRTLGQLGGGIAHQLRNSVTGCRMALDLHLRECPEVGRSENVSVAIRQLTLMEKYVRQFLAMKGSQRKPHVRTDLAALVETVLPLARPAAAHAGVVLDWDAPAGPCAVMGDPEGLEQLVVNLLLNAIEAAARGVAGEPGTVQLRIESAGEERVAITVEDSGGGPPAEIAERLFEPLVTGKKDGAGLGLSVVREICEQHGGTVRWERRSGKTCFVVDLPAARAEHCCVETFGC